MIDFLLLAISTRAIATYAWMGGGGLGNERGYSEGVKIMPHYPFLKIVMTCLFAPLKPALHGLDATVCFLQIGAHHANIAVSCDWCSICNGILETATQNLVQNPALRARINFPPLRRFDAYLGFILVERRERVADDEIHDWCERTFGEKTVGLLLLSQIYLKCERIELRWRPFRRSVALYYRNKDPRYVEPTDHTIRRIGEILSRYETITCTDCPKVLNHAWRHPRSNRRSMFQPLLDYMSVEIARCGP